MSEAADLVEWLLTTAANSDNPKHFAPRLRQAADRIVSQEAEIAKLREALEELACFTQTERLLWWQMRARLALSENTDDKG